MDNFCGLGKKYSEYEKSKAVIVPIPYEMTTTYLKGTAKAPRAIIEASKKLELYDEELDKVISDIGICTLTPLKISEKNEAMALRVKQHCLKVLNDNKFPVIIGGEHSISTGVVLAVKQKYTEFSVLQFDAHADLRDEYKGSKYNHGCAMARIREHGDAVQVGIRSLSYEESELIRKNNYKIIWDKDRKDISSCIKEILGGLKKDVYITIDTDVFDPGFLPSVGTPEPGGLLWYDILDITKAVFKNKNVVGLDVVELCPSAVNKASDFIIAKLIYKMLGYKFFI